MKLLISLFACLTCSASPWQVGYWDNRGNGGYGRYVMFPATSPSALAQFDFRTYDTRSNYYLAGPLTVTMPPTDLQGKRIRFTAHIETNGATQFSCRLGGANPKPSDLAQCRLWFTTTSSTFDTRVSNGDQLSYWWSSTAWVTLAQLTANAVTITCNLSDDKWTAAHAQSSKVESNAFNYALEHVEQAGVFISQYFYDLGCGTSNGTGTATFVLDRFDILNTKPKLIVNDAAILLEN